MQCDCQSGKDFQACCQPLLEGAAAPDALSLMRSRFTAFARGNAAYILATEAAWLHPNLTPEALKKELAHQKWRALEIADVGENWVVFHALLIEAGTVYRVSEHSLFKRLENRWIYTEAQSTSIVKLNISRNDACPCQSGKKFKKCCDV